MKLDLTKYGITDVKEIIHNPSYEELFAAETDPSTFWMSFSSILLAAVLLIAIVALVGFIVQVKTRKRY